MGDQGKSRSRSGGASTGGMPGTPGLFSPSTEEVHSSSERALAIVIESQSAVETLMKSRILKEVNQNTVPIFVQALEHYRLANGQNPYTNFLDPEKCLPSIFRSFKVRDTPKVPGSEQPRWKPVKTT